MCWKHPSPFSNVHFRYKTKIAAQVLALNFLLFALLLSFSLNYELISYFWFCSFFQLYGSFNCTNSTSLSFSEFSELFTFILLLSQHIESQFALPCASVTSDIIMSVLHKSSMFFASLCILDVPQVSFLHASSRFLRVPYCSSLQLLLIGPVVSHLATIKRWGNT